MGKIETPAVRARKDRRVQSMDSRIFFATSLVLRVEQTVRAGAVKRFAISSRSRDARVRRVVAGKRLARLKTRSQSMRASAAGSWWIRPAVQRRLGPSLPIASADLVLDFFLVERTRQRRFLAGRGVVVLLLQRS